VALWLTLGGTPGLRSAADVAEVVEAVRRLTLRLALDVGSSGRLALDVEAAAKVLAISAAQVARALLVVDGSDRASGLSALVVARLGVIIDSADRALALAVADLLRIALDVEGQT